MASVPLALHLFLVLSAARLAACTDLAGRGVAAAKLHMQTGDVTDFTCGVGAGLAGGDLMQLANITIADAEAICAANATCGAFTFEGNVTCSTWHDKHYTKWPVQHYWDLGIALKGPPRLE